MQLISSDTSVWIDFEVIDALTEPFLLNGCYSFLMSAETMDAELQYPSDLSTRLEEYGLVRTELQEDEYLLVLTLGSKYKQLSSYDTFALAIAQNRSIPILTGDGALRKAAEKEGIAFHGTLLVIDRLWEEKLITQQRYKEMLGSLKGLCGGAVRLPLDEIDLRLRMLEDE